MSIFEFRSSQDNPEPDATASYDDKGMIVDARTKVQYSSLAQWAKSVKGRAVSVKPYIFYRNKSLRQHEGALGCASPSTPQNRKPTVPEGGGRKSQRGKKESRGLGAASTAGQGEGGEEPKQAGWSKSSRPQRSCARLKKPIDDDEVLDSEDEAHVEAGRDDDGEWNGTDEDVEDEDEDEDGGDDDDWNPSADERDSNNGSNSRRKSIAVKKGKVSAQKRTPARQIGKYFMGGAPPSSQGRTRGRATARARAAVRPSKKRRAASAVVEEDEDSASGSEESATDAVGRGDPDVVGSSSRGRGREATKGRNGGSAADGSTSTGRSKRETGTADAKRLR